MTNDALVSFTLRMPERMSREIERLAKQMGISKNAYILMILHKAVERHQTTA